MQQLKQKRAVITGAGSGIGAAIARAYAAEGARLVLGARGEAGLQDIARRCREVGGIADIQVVDTTDAAAVAAFAASARDLLGEIDLWFSCVGVGVVGRAPRAPPPGGVAVAAHQRRHVQRLAG